MKNKILFFASLFFLVLFSVTGCKKEDQSGDENPTTDAIQKTVTLYHEGMIKNEGPGNTDDPKIETELPLSMKEQIREELEKSFSKQKVYLKDAGNLVGVFKNGSCGSYPVLLVNMDAEDTGTSSSASGWTGDSNKTSYGNIQLYFCVVNDAYFVRTPSNYAVLTLTAGLPDGVSRINRYFDNEDSGNGNFTTLNGSSYTGWHGDCYFGTDTQLSFYFYNSKSDGPGFPNLGISYGVLGNFGTSGYLFSDDEDSGNSNWCKWSGTSAGSSWEYEMAAIPNISGTPNILEAGANTKLFLSAVY